MRPPLIRYRMRVFKPGREPELWQIHDLLADNDDDAKRQAGGAVPAAARRAVPLAR